MLKALPAARWDYDTAAHLLNRAGFGGPPAVIKSWPISAPTRRFPPCSITNSMPDPTPDPDWAKPDPEGVKQLRDAAKNATPDERRKLYQQEMRVQFQRLMELRGWWLNRMAKGPRPFQEKMVLFWHGHFATSFEKVRNAYYMWRQNELFRRLATGNWQELLTLAGKDPAMLIWLDQAQSRKAASERKFRARSHGAFFARRRPLHRKGRHRGRAGADRLVAGPAESGLCLPPVFPRQRRSRRFWARPAISTATT